MRNDLTAERVRFLLDYDSLTGLMFWKVRKGAVQVGDIAGCSCSDGYIRIKIDGILYLAQRIAWLHHYGVWPTFEADHHDRDRENNAIRNLRDATPTQNRANSKIRSTNKTGFKGICFDTRRGKYRADIRANGKRLTLGYFDDPKLAAATYNMAAKAAHGNFALVGEE